MGVAFILYRPRLTFEMNGFFDSNSDGATGPPGPQGPKGDPCDPPGPEGDIGEHESVGPHGEKGDRRPIGPQGQRLIQENIVRGRKLANKGPRESVGLLVKRVTLAITDLRESLNQLVLKVSADHGWSVDHLESVDYPESRAHRVFQDRFQKAIRWGAHREKLG